MTIDISNFYLNSPLPCPEFVKIKINNIPEEIIKEYKLRNKVTPQGYVYVIDHMRTRFVRALSVTICAILAIKYIARIDAYRARIVSSIPRIVSDCSHIVRPKLADTNFGRSLSHWRPFLVLFLCHNGPIGIFEKVVRRWGSPFAHCRSDRTAPFLKR